MYLIWGIIAVNVWYGLTIFGHGCAIFWAFSVKLSIEHQVIIINLLCIRKSALILTNLFRYVFMINVAWPQAQGRHL